MSLSTASCCVNRFPGGHSDRAVSRLRGIGQPDRINAAMSVFSPERRLPREAEPEQEKTGDPRAERDRSRVGVHTEAQEEEANRSGNRTAERRAERMCE
jgi:hypothetical protein